MKPVDLTTLNHDQLVERWKAWLKETEQEMFRLYWSKATFDAVQKMYQTNPKLREVGGINYDWLLRLFVSDSLISIRREVEKGGSRNLMNLLFEIEKFCEPVLTRKHYVAMYGDGHWIQQHLGHSDFNEKNGAMCHFPQTTADDDCICSDSIERERDRIEAGTKKSYNYAQWFIAHRTPKEPYDITLKEIYDAFDVIFETFGFFHTLLTGGVWVEKVPVPQFDWTAVYRIPWATAEFFEKSQATEERRRAESKAVLGRMMNRRASTADGV